MAKLTVKTVKVTRLSELKSLLVPSEKSSVTFRVEAVATDKGLYVAESPALQEQD